MVSRRHDQLVTCHAGDPSSGPAAASVSNPLVEETGKPRSFVHDINSPEISHEGRELPSGQAIYSGGDTTVRRYPARDRKTPDRIFK